jgi:AmmeMemoRadiSam system protein A
MLVAIGAIHDLTPDCEVLHYEAPFGVGYLVAQLTRIKTSNGNKEAAVENTLRDEEATDLPGIARRAVETFVITGQQIPAPRPAGGILSARAACFVSVKTLAGDLRGCIGTVEPVKQTLAEELIMNSISAVTRDPRFNPVTEAELPNLHYSVDVLTSSEPTTFEDLDPAVYGVIVEDERGMSRGLLLPDIEGVDTPRKQVEIAARKAGIQAGAPIRLSRFRVTRFREK